MNARISETDLILRPDGRVYHLGLRPEDVATDIIVVGDPERVAKVSRYFDQVVFRQSHREFVTHTGTLRGNRISVMSTGIGTDNVEIFFHELDALVNIDLETREWKNNHTSFRIVRTGTSGSLQPDIPVGSLVCAVAAVGLDNLMSFYRLPQTQEDSLLTKALSQAAGFAQPYMAHASKNLIDKYCASMVHGNTVTCPGFYAPQGRTVRLPIRFPRILDDLQEFEWNGFRLTNFEMETSCYYALASLLGHEVVSANAILANRPLHKFSTDPDAVIDHLIREVLDRF